MGKLPNTQSHYVQQLSCFRKSLRLIASNQKKQERERENRPGVQHCCLGAQGKSGACRRRYSRTNQADVQRSKNNSFSFISEGHRAHTMYVGVHLPSTGGSGSSAKRRSHHRRHRHHRHHQHHQPGIEEEGANASDSCE